jgi:hypothetical protein
MKLVGQAGLKNSIEDLTLAKGVLYAADGFFDLSGAVLFARR